MPIALRRCRWPLQVTTTVELTKAGWEWVGPGGRLHPEEFLERYYGHIIIECVLAVVIGYLFLQQSFKWSSKKEKPLTEEVCHTCLT